MKKRFLIPMLAVLVALVSISVMALTASAATAPTEGMSFDDEYYYEMTNAPSMSGSITIEASIWLAPDASKSRQGTIFGNYCDDYDNNGKNLGAYGLEIHENGTVRFYTRSFGDYRFTTFEDGTAFDVRKFTGTTTAPQYVKLALTADVVNHKVSLYVNGEFVSSIVDQKMTAGVFAITTESLCVGADRRIGNIQYFKGKIRDVALYSDLRTAEEIAASAADGYVVDAADANLVVAYDLTAAVPFEDLSANDNDLRFNSIYGSSFASGDPDRSLENKLTVQPRTYEALIYAPTLPNRTGVILGNYELRTVSGKNVEQPCLNFEIHSNGTPSLYIKRKDGVVAKPKFNGVDENGNRYSDVRRNKWVHLVIVDDGANFYCYIDGVLTETLPYTQTGVLSKGTEFSYTIEEVQSVNNLSIGRDRRDNQIFKGRIKHIALYSEVLTPAEIKSAYQNGVDKSNDSLMAYYDMSDGDAGSVIEDETGNGHSASPWYFEREKPVKDYAYSFAIVGDTQMQVWKDYLSATDATVGNETEYTKKIYKWIIDNKDKKNIQYVFGVGDITQNNGLASKGSGDLEWEIAKEAITQLDVAGIPYGLVMGNHDTAARLNEYFAYDFYTSRVSGYYAEGDLANYYINFEVAGTKYMYLGLEYGPRDAVLEWAGRVADANPERRIIVATHAYMFRDGTTLDKGDVVPPNATGEITSASSKNNGDMMWEKFASQHRNILFVISGHDPYSNIAFRQDRGENGNLVSQFLVDPQSMDVGLGMVCMLYFSEDGKDVSVEWISTGKTQAAQANDPEADDILYKDMNQFDFEVYDYVGNGIYSTEFVSREGNIDTYRIYYTNGTYNEYTVTNGVGVTVTDISKTSEGLVDTYTITFSDGSTAVYTVTNGENGKDGTDGADGKTPYIGENGNWWIGSEDTGIRADGGEVVAPDYGIELDGGSFSEDMYWAFTDKNILVISGNGAMKDYTNTVVAPWMAYKDEVTSIVIEEGVMSIGNNAFSGMDKVKSVSLPTTLTTIGSYAFYGCSRLESADIPARTRYIGKYAFRKSGVDEVVFRVTENWTVDGVAAENLDLAGVTAQNLTSKLYQSAWELGGVEDGDVLDSGYCGENVIWTMTYNGTLTVSGEGDMEFTRAPWKKYMTVIYKTVIDDTVKVKDGAFSGANKLK